MSLEYDKINIIYFSIFLIAFKSVEKYKYLFLLASLKI